MKKFFVCALALGAAVGVFALGTKDAPKKDALTLRVGAIKGPSGLGMIHLFEKPFTTNEVHIVPELAASPDAMAARIIMGDIEAAVLPVNMAAKLYNAGRPYRLIQVVGNGMLKLLSTDPSVTSIASLKGKTLHVAGQGATPEFLMRTLFAKNGMDPDKDLTLVFNMPHPELAASIAAGRVSIAVLPEPFATLALRGKAKEAFKLSELWTQATGRPDYPMSVLVIRADIFEKHPNAVRALMAAYNASMEQVLANPSEAGALAEKHGLGIKADVAAEAIPACNFTFEPAPEAKPNVEALLALFLEAAPASIGAKLPDETWYARIPK